jgi:primosomal protein N' (replication factor Y) (superfamily II helicase)
MARKKSSSSAALVNVAVMAAIRNPLTYRVPEGAQLKPGQRVQVPLGTRRALGIVLETVGSVAPGIRVREITRVLGAEPIVSPELLKLGLWIGEYYLAPVGEVFRSMLPLRAEAASSRIVQMTGEGKVHLVELESSLLDEFRSGTEARLMRFVAENPRVSLDRVRRRFVDSPMVIEDAVTKKWIEIEEIERSRGWRKIFRVRVAAGPVPAPPTRLSPAAKRILKALEENGTVGDHRPLLKASRASLRDLNRLKLAGLINLEEAASRGAMEKFSTPGASLPSGNSQHVLASAQEIALKDLISRMDRKDFGTVLLHGITASGKTEIYMRLISECLERGRTALMLVPEIALTPSAQAQFLERFGGRVAVLHSGLSENERHAEWWRVRRGEAKVVLGTRSAVFAPISGLGVLIVDEEHDPSYKQQESPRYHGRDVAVVRGRLEKALVILGSATPSLESAENARQGKYYLLKLEERVAGRSLASVEIVDMREEFRETFSQVPISRRLKEEIETQLRAHAQTMILLNRRGYAWFVLCRSCGQTQRCINCSISLTYHRREHRQVCHYCGYTAAVPSKCPNCASEHLHFVGEGTEKLEAKFAEFFPDARVARLDRDVARRAEHFAKVLSDFREGKIDILVGTQMIAKGHDFPGVTLVGVVSVDAGLSLPDFRSAERTFQLLTQAEGRAGRGDAPGRVLVQTFFPEHYAVRMAAEQNYEAFFSKEIRFRRAMHYPPCAALANVVAQDETLERAARVAQVIGKFLAALDGESRALKILGPSPAPLARIKGRHRIQFLLKSNSRSRLNLVLRGLMEECERRGIPPRAVMIDVDPVSIM